MELSITARQSLTAPSRPEAEHEAASLNSAAGAEKKASGKKSGAKSTAKSSAKKKSSGKPASKTGTR